MNQDSQEHDKNKQGGSDADGVTFGAVPEPARRVPRTLLFAESPQLKKIRKLLASKLDVKPAPPDSTGPKTLLDNEVPVQPARRVARTLLEVPLPDLAQIQAAEAAAAAKLGESALSTSDPAVTVSHDSFSDSLSEPLSEPFSESFSEPFSEPAALSANAPHSADAQLVDRVISRSEPRQNFVAKTRLDQSVLADTVQRYEIRKGELAAEEAKLRASLPVIEFHPVDSKRLALPCPWTWSDDDSKDRFRYCPKCKAQAYNFDGLELPAAEALIFKRENKEAPVLYKRADGKFMTRDCPFQVKRRRRIILTSIAAGAAVVGLVILMILMPPPALVHKTATIDANDSAADVPEGAVSVDERSVTVPDNKPVYVIGPDGKRKRKRPTFGPEDKDSYWE